MTINQFVQDMFTEYSHFDKPELMTVNDARYNIVCYKAVDGIRPPRGLTAELYALLWNRLVRKAENPGRETGVKRALRAIRKAFDETPSDVLPAMLEAMFTSVIN